MTSTDPQHRIRQSGFWLSMLTFIFTLVALVIAITTPPRSGPFCSSGCIDYPYIDAAAFVPRDYLWMGPALLLTIFFLRWWPAFIMLLLLRKRYTHIWRFCLPLFQPPFSLWIILSSCSSCNRVFSKEKQKVYPSFHSTIPMESLLPWNIWVIWWWAWVFSFLAFVFKARKGVERAIRRWFFIGFVLAIASLIILLSVYGLDIEYRFECAIILINWCILTVTAVLLSIFFRRLGRQE